VFGELDCPVVVNRHERSVEVLLSDGTGTLFQGTSAALSPL
jgi:hypothetical protein